MSVAAELARLRSSTFPSVPAGYTPSILYNAKEAAREPRIETAGAALNGLEALSAGDAALPHLAEALLLHSSRDDRANLEPEREKEVSHAVVVAAHRLAPVFPLRHTQKVLEWMVRGLEVGRLGQPEEVDALLISALPFHASEAFVKLVSAVLIPSPSRSTWKWLQPVVDQKKPIAIDFIVANAHPEFFLKAVRQVAVSALAGISSQHLNGLIVNIISRRVLHSGVHPLESRTLVLTCLEALCFKRKRFYLVAGKKPKGQQHPPGVARCLNRAKIALLIVLSTAVAGGVEQEIRDAILHAAVTVLTQSLSDEMARNTATTCVILCLGSAKYQHMPPGLAKLLAKWEKFPHALMSLETTQGACESFGVYLCALAKLAPTHKRALSGLRDGLSMKWQSLLSDGTVRNVVCVLLDAYSPAEGFQEEDGNSTPSKSESLTETLLPIVRGSHATALDGALRRHFDERRKKKSGGGRYAIVDKSLSLAMAGTPYVAVKTSGLSSGPEVSEDTLLSCLEHPEPSVRLSGLKRLVDEKTLVDTAKDSELADTFRGILMRRITIESDLRVVTAALNSNLIQTFCDLKEAMQAVGKRYRELFAALSSKKRSKPSTRVLEFTSAAFAFCCKASLESDNMRIAALALFIGLDMDGVLPSESVRTACTGDTALINLKYGAFEVAGPDLERIVAALFSWHNLWGLEYTKTIFPTLTKTSVEHTVFVEQVANIIKLALDCRDAGAAKVNESTQAILSALKLLPELDAAGVVCLKQLWLVIAGHDSSEVLQDLVKVICATQGPQRLYEFLKDASEDWALRQARILALQWRAAMLKAGIVSEGQSSLVHHLLVAAYSNDAEVRKSAADICQQLQSSELKLEDSDTSRIVFSRLQHSLAKAAGSGKFASQFDTVGEMDEIAVQIHDQLYKTFPDLRDIPNALAASPDEEDNLVRAIFSLAQSDLRSLEKFQNGLSLLRSLYNASVSSSSSIASLFTSLQELLSMDVRLFENTTCTEALVRLVAMIPLPSKPIAISPTIVSLGKLFITIAQSLNDIALTPLVALYGKAIATGLFKIVAILRQTDATEENQAVASDAVAHLFWISTFSSVIGEFAAKLVDYQKSSVIVSDDFERVAGYLTKALPTSSKKRRRTASTASEPSSPKTVVGGFNSRVSVTGALEALARSNLYAEDGQVAKEWALSNSLLNSLWLFVRSSLDNVKNGNSAQMEDFEYQLSLVLRALAEHFTAKNSPGAVTGLGKEDAVSAVDICFYPGVDCERELSVIERGIRASAIALLEALAKRHSETLREHVVPFLEHVVRTDSSASSHESFAKIVLLLLQGGFSVAEFMKLALESNSGAERKDGLSVTDCILMCPDRKAATAAAVNLVFTDLAILNEQATTLAKCIDIILHSGNSVEQILSVLSESNVHSLATLAMNVVGHPEFLLQLDSHLQQISSIDDRNDEREPDYIRLEDLFWKLFHKLLSSEDDMRQNALCAVLAIVPGPVVCACIERAIEARTGNHPLRAVQSLNQRLEVNTPIPTSWQGGESSAEQTEGSKLIFKNICKMLRPCISLCFGLDSSSATQKFSYASDLGLTAIVALHRIILRSGQAHIEEVQQCGSLIADLVRTKNRSSDHFVALSNGLICLSSIVRVLGKNGSVFVPPLSIAVADVMQKALCQKSSDLEIADDKFFLIPLPSNGVGYMSEQLAASVQACTEVLETAPKMFGKRSLRRIAAMAATVPRDSVTEVLHLAVTKVPASHALDSLAVALKCVQNSPCDVSQGIRIVMESLAKLVTSLRKSEMKLLKMDILQLCLSAMDYRYTKFTAGQSQDEEGKGVNGFAQRASLGLEETVASCRMVEEACYSTLTEVILRVPESEFKVMFNKLANWSEANRLLEDEKDVLDKFGVDAPDTILRLIPMQGLCGELFGILRAILCPYFAGVLERSLKVISTARVAKSEFAKQMKKKTLDASSGKKRGREVFETESDGKDRSFGMAMEDMRHGLVKKCLDNVELFLRHVPDSDEVSTATLIRIQDSVLASFDSYGEEYLEVERALCALALRMMVTGTYRTKEQSRELICGLSKALLQRAGSESVNMRRGSLVVASAVADAVGDEYLVALPEAMPVLADVVDDERDEVAKAAKMLVSKLEGLSGEAILEQLK